MGLFNLFGLIQEGDIIDWLLWSDFSKKKEVEPPKEVIPYKHPQPEEEKSAEQEEK